MIKKSVYFIDNQYFKSKLIVLSALLLFLLSGCDNSRVYWQETYEHQTNLIKQYPFDVSILREALPTAEMPVKDIKNKLAYGLPKEGEGECYVFIGEAIELDSNDVRALRNFIERGNTAFIASKYISKRLLRPYVNQKIVQSDVYKTEEEEITEEDVSEEDSDNQGIVEEDQEQTTNYYEENNLSKKIEYQTFRDSFLTVQLFQPDSFTYQTGFYNAINKLNFATEHRFFNHFIENGFLKEAKALGSVQGKYINFLSLPFGKGKLFIHSMPILFTNVEIIEPQGKIHIEKVLSNLPTGKVYWDKVNQTDIATAQRLDEEVEEKQGRNNILKYVVGHPSLASAWYLILGGTVLFFVFGAKRRQRIIPVISSKNNTSLVYIQSLGRLYFQRQNHRQLAIMKYKFFLSFVRSKYGIKTTKIDDSFINGLNEKSGISKQLIGQLINDAQYAVEQPIDEYFLVNLHNNMQYFYKNCK
jgi:hypothetical protein